VLLVDPQEASLREMKSWLAAMPSVEVVAESRTTEEARGRLLELKPDLLLIEAETPDGDGIELLRGLESRPATIFVGRRQEYALRAYELQSLDYLLKPVNRQRFVDSIARAIRRIAETRIASLASQIVGVAAAIAPDMREAVPASPRTYVDRITIRVRRRVFWLNVCDIHWIQGASQYSRIHAKCGEFLLARSLASLESQLDPGRFFRVHKSTIVNAEHVQEIRSGGEGRYSIYLRGGPALPLSRSRRDVLDKLMAGVSAFMSRNVPSIQP
jgi:two-component system LytT family response regulator